MTLCKHLRAHKTEKTRVLAQHTRMNSDWTERTFAWKRVQHPKTTQQGSFIYTFFFLNSAAVFSDRTGMQKSNRNWMSWSFSIRYYVTNQIVWRTETGGDAAHSLLSTERNFCGNGLNKLEVNDFGFWTEWCTYNYSSVGMQAWTRYSKCYVGQPEPISTGLLQTYKFLSPTQRTRC